MAIALEPNLIREPHQILIRTDRGPGDHWDCTCGRWTFDSPVCLTIPEVQQVLKTFDKHK